MEKALNEVLNHRPRRGGRIRPALPSMRTPGRGEQVLNGSRVVPENAPLSHTKPPVLEHHDAAGFQRLGGVVDRLPAADDAEVRVPHRQLVDETINALLEIAARD